MKIIKRAVGLAAIGGLVAGGIAFAAPSNASGPPTTVATCAGTKGLGTAKSTTVGDGITDKDNQDVSIGIKGVPNPSTSPSSFGSCTYAPGLSTPDNSKPPVKGFSGNKALLKWGVKLFSPESDCNTADTTDLTEWPLNGKLSVTYTALNAQGTNEKADSYIAVQGFTDPDNDPTTPSDVVWARGVVTKGVAAGADVYSETYFDPTVKDKTQTTESPYPGYQFDIAGALGCTTATVGDANILGFVSGDGTSLLLSLPASGIKLTIGN